jgi:hypothetical protein
MSRQKPDRVVIEYRYRGYTPPDLGFGEALRADEVNVTFSTVPAPPQGDLYDVRFELEDDGFEYHGAQVIDRGSRFYDPKWREVWQRTPRPVGHASSVTERNTR